MRYCKKSKKILVGILGIVVVLIMVVGILFWKNKASETKIEARHVQRVIQEVEKMGTELGYENAFSELTEASTTTLDGNTYYRLQQNYNGIPVYGRTVVCVKNEDGEMQSLTGNALDVKSGLDLTPEVTQEQVEDKILDYVAWELDGGAGTFSFMPISDNDLVIYNEEDSESYLAYDLETYFESDEEIQIYQFIVDAHTAEVLHVNSQLLQDEDVRGDLQGQEETYENIKYSKEGNVFQLVDRAYDIETFLVDTEKINGLEIWWNFGKWSINAAIGESSTDFESTLVTWEESENPDKSAVDAYVNAQITYEYFEDELNNESTDGKGKADIYVVTGMEYARDDEAESGYQSWKNNAYSYSVRNSEEQKTVLVFGNGILFKDSLSSILDVVAHEYMHGVTTLHANLESEGESGAIDEALSDIFGELVEYWHNRKTNNSYELDWIHNVLNPRNLRNPEESDNPHVYQGENWDSVDEEVHKNSTVISHAAYLMWNGIEGNEEKKLSESQLAHLWYNAVLMMPSDCDFSMCRSLVELAARNMNLTEEQIKCVGEAFDRVGIEGEDFVYEVSIDGVLQVLDGNGETYGNYTLYILPVGIQADASSLVGLQVDPEKIIEKSEDCRVITTNEPQQFNLQAGTYAIAIVDNENEAQIITKTIRIVSNGGADIVSIQTDFGFPKQYAELIEKYIAAFPWRENRSGTIPGLPEASYLYRYFDTLNEIGYALIDIDNNGVKELLIGTSDQETNTMYDVFTITDGKAVQILSSGERSQYTLRSDGYIILHWSNSAYNSGTDKYKINSDGDSLLFVERKTYDAFYAEEIGLIEDVTEGTADTCYFISKNSENYEDYVHVTLEEVKKMSEEHLSNERNIQYIPFSEYVDNTNKESSTEQSDIAYEWVVEPTIEADNIYYLAESNGTSMNEGSKQSDNSRAVIQRGETLGIIDLNGNLMTEMIYKEIYNYGMNYMMKTITPQYSEDYGMDWEIYWLYENGEVAASVGSGALGFEGYYFYEGNQYHVSGDVGEIEDMMAPEVVIPVQETTMKFSPDNRMEWLESLNGKYALSKNGELTSGFVFDECGSYSDGLIAVCQNGKWGYVDENLSVVIPCEYDASWKNYSPFAFGGRTSSVVKDFCYAASDGYVVLCKANEWELRDTDGEAVIPAGTFEELRPVFGGKCWVKKDGRWGVIQLR